MSSTSSSPKEETYEEDREFESQAKRLKTEEGEIVYSAEESENRQEATPQAGSDSDSGGGGDGGGGGGGDGEEGEGGEEGDGEEGDEGDGEEGGSGGDEGGSGGGPRSMPPSTVTKRGAASLLQGRATGLGLAARLSRPPLLCCCVHAERVVGDLGLLFIYLLHAFPESGRRMPACASVPGPELGEGCGVGAAGAGVASAPGGCAARPRRDQLFVS